MRLTNRVRFAGAVLALFVLASPSFAQDVPESHVKAARGALDALNATDSFDTILPSAAQALKQQLIQTNPDLEALIVATVDEKTLSMVGRRADLEREAALVYARSFSEPELNEIAAFYSSEAGKKLIQKGPAVTGELIRASEIWRRGVARDLSQEVATKLNQVVQASRPDAATVQAPAPEEGGGETAAQ